MRLKFLGGVGTVTGSKTLCSYQRSNFLVDCGLFQGPRELRNFNWNAQPSLKATEFVLLTHAHIDHSGYLPKLVRDGFRGPIYCSKATADLCRILLPDAAYLQEEDASFANRTGHSKHKPALPLYTEQDARETLKLLQPVPMETWIELRPGLSYKLSRAGHILGSSVVHVGYMTETAQRLVTFSGDLGRNTSRVIKGPSVLQETDDLILESTYGDRIHPKVDHKAALETIVNKVIGRGGTLVIPAFSVGRTQDILLLLHDLKTEGRLPDVPVYVDSPMAQEATTIYRNHEEELKPGISGDDVLLPLTTLKFHSVKTPDDSMMLCMNDDPKIVISAAGMLSGGRVLHHLRAKLPHEKNGVVFVGFQAEGTKGRLLQNGLTRIRIHHQEVDVEAEIFTIESLSAHADSDEILAWVKGSLRPPKRIFINHGEPASAKALAYRIRTELGIDRVYIPEQDQEFLLED